MITMAKNPSLRWLRVSNKNVDDRRAHTVWASVGKDEILIHRSWNSLKLIVEWSKKHFQKETPVLFVPEYYCYDTIFQLREDVELIYYPINEELKPDMKTCRELAKQVKPDLFLFVHFWGKILDGNDVSVFCRQNEAVFIEDAVHVLEPDKRIGQLSDFILFSPWKLLGLPDGAVLVIGKKNRYQVDKNELEILLEDLVGEEAVSDKSVFLWKCRKLLLKLVPNLHTGSQSSLSAYEKEKIKKITSYSKKILTQISKEELLEIGERRKENNLYIVEYCKRKYGVHSLLSDDTMVPYMAAIRVQNSKVKELLVKDFQKVGKVVTSWPSLSPDLAKESYAKVLAEDIVAITVHDNLTPNLLAGRLKDKFVSSDEGIVIQEVEKRKYDAACAETTDVLPLLQTSIYGVVKSDTQNWTAEYYIISKDSKDIACFMVLKKRRILTVYRVNQGVVWLTAPDEITKYEIYYTLKHKFSGFGKLLFLASRERREGNNISLMIRNGLHYRKQYTSTGYLDLYNTEEDMRKRLDSKWRNQLKVAESHGFMIKYSTNSEELEKLLYLHIQHKNEAKYKDSGDNITRGLIDLGALVGYFVNEGTEKILAFIMVVLHGTSATYYIGWSSEEGYKLNLNKLLLWNAMIDLKKKGFHWFDLGGIDFIHTPGIADFKMGTGCEYYETVGEFV